MYPKAYIDYLLHFHCDRDYFECHEILEEYWKEKPKEERDLVLVGLIQIAVALYHERRGNLSGATKMIRKAINSLAKEHTALFALHIHADDLLEILAKRYNQIGNLPFNDLQIPLYESLLNYCKEEAIKQQLIWNTPSSEDSFLLNKHILRNRNEVIE